MKRYRLNENTPLKIVEVTNHINTPSSDFDENTNKNTIEIKQIQMKVFTDGEIKESSEEVVESINEYYICNEKYKHPVDTLKTKNLFSKITVTLLRI